MTATRSLAIRPQAARAAFLVALNAGHAQQAAACFARDGCLVTPDATAVSGRGAIAGLLAQLIDRNTKIEVRHSDSLCAGEAAIASERWRIQSGHTPKDAFTQEAKATLVLRAIEGEWKLSILAPWGWGGG